jgi:hypothetical protein
VLFGLSLPAFVQPAECMVKIDGVEIADLYPFIMSVSVEASRHEPARATIVFASPADEVDHWPVADDPRLLPDAAIKIEADFLTAREEVMRGVVKSVTPNYPSNAGDATVTVTAEDDSARFDRAPRLKPWGKGLPSGTTDLAIVTEILGGSGVILDPFSGAGHAGIFPNQRTADLVFLTSRANANGYELLFQKGLLYFGPMRTSHDAQPPIMVYAGRASNCRTFVPANTADRPDRYSYTARDANGDGAGEIEVVADEPLMGLMPARASSSGLAPHTGRLDRRTSPSDAENAARARQLAINGQFSIRAEGELDGALYGHVLKVGLPVEVDGVGDANSGRYYVDKVTHLFDVNGYKQNFVLLRNALGRAPSASIGGAVSAVMGA